MISYNSAMGNIQELKKNKKSWQKFIQKINVSYQVFKDRKVNARLKFVHFLIVQTPKNPHHFNTISVSPTIASDLKST